MQKSISISLLPILLCIALIGISKFSSGQLKANFVADTLSFCPPYSVTFKDLSNGGRITSRRWEFGQGGTSNTNNPFPSATYLNSGSYTVKLVVSDGTVSDSIVKTAYIQAFKLPVANFSTKETPSGCAPLPLNFEDKSTVGDAPFHSRKWNFGDGYRSTKNNPFHNYRFDGKYSITYSVTDSNGCTSTIKKSAYVNAIKGPDVKFSTTPASSSCQAPHTVSFVNQTTGIPSLTYLWIFGGGGGTSILKSPSKTYGAGLFDVTLVVTDGAGCTDTLKKNRFVTVGAAKADFVMEDTFCLSDSNLFQFTNLSVGGSTYYWDFGDGKVSRAKDPTHNYIKTGTYNVRLIIGLGTACTDTIVKTVEVIQPYADFTTDLNYWCDDTTVLFTPKGNFLSEAKKVRWDFMYWQEPRNPVTKYDTARDSKSTSGWHYDTLTVYYPKWGSCSAKVINKTIRIWRPKGSPFIDPTEGCAPLTVNFLSNILPQDSVTVGTWTFNNFSPVKALSTQKTYNTAGFFNVNYTVHHIKGCKYKYGPYTIGVGTPQKADFKLDSTEVCVKELVTFTNLSTDSSKITEYFWKFDANKGTPTSKIRHPTTEYNDTGLVSVFLRVSHNGCKDSITKKDILRILGPIGKMQVGIDCDKPYERTFTPRNWVDVHRFKYEFGDGVGVDSLNRNTSYTYASRGDYQAKLTLINDSTGCMVEDVEQIMIRDLKLVSSVDTHIACNPAFFKFDTRLSQDVENGRIISYGKNILLADSAFMQFSVKSGYQGSHVPIVVAYDINGCTDTNLHTIKTYRPIVKIHSNLNQGCGTLKVQFIDSSVSDTTFVSRLWSGAGLTPTNSKTPTFLFKTPGEHAVKLVVRDTLGCEGVGVKKIKVFKPLPAIVVDTQLCVGERVRFTNSGAQAGDIQTWSLGDSLFGSGTHVDTSYAKEGRKSIQLKVTDKHGCDSTLDKNLWVDVQEVKRPNVISLPNDTTCYPAEIDFVILNPDSNIKFRYWRFDTADAYIRLVGPTSFNNYDKPGIYGVDVKLESTYGCLDTFRFDSILRIRGPYARFDSEDTFCLSVESDINLTEASGVYEYRMDFGDGNVDTFPGMSTIIKHTYSNPGLYPLYLIFTDSLGNCVKSWSDSVFVQQVIANINVKDTVGCPPFALLANADLAPVDKYIWSVDNKVYSDKQFFTKTLDDSGSYTVRLQPIDTNTGCFDIDSVRIRVFPVPNLNKTGDGLYCYKDSTEVELSGAKSFRWHPDKYLSSPIARKVRVLPEEDIKYVVEGKNEHGCKSSIDVEFKVIRAPSLYELKDTTAYLGQTIQLNQPYAGDLIFKWSPAIHLSCTDCANPEINIKRDITYTLTVADKYGCFSLDTSFSITMDADYVLLIPNAFTPNSDGLNETFKFVTKGLKELEYFGIYNRWGEEVYSFSSLDDEWDGTYNGDLWPSNAKLVYRGHFLKYNGESIFVSGFIVLLR